MERAPKRPSSELIHDKFGLARDEKPTLSAFQQFRLFCSLCPTIARSLYRHTVKGPVRKEWSALYSVCVDLMRVVPFGNEKEADFRQLQAQMRIDLLGQKRTRPFSYKVKDEVVDFMHDRCPGEWVNADCRDVISGTTYVHKSVKKKAMDADTICLMFHGGGFVIGSDKHLGLYALQLSKQSGLLIFCPDYRLAPQNPFPCYIIDAVSAYLYLLQTYPGKKIVLTGDSAGGNICLVVTHVLMEMGIVLPTRIALISPWVDLTVAPATKVSDYLPSLNTQSEGRKGKRNYLHCHDADLAHPFISPIKANGHSFGRVPILMISGEGEMFLEQNIAFAKKFAELGSPIIHEIYHSHTHDFPIFLPFKGSQNAIERIGAWISSQKIDENQQSKTRNYSFDGDLVQETNL